MINGNIINTDSTVGLFNINNSLTIRLKVTVMNFNILRFNKLNDTSFFLGQQRTIMMNINNFPESFIYNGNLVIIFDIMSNEIKFIERINMKKRTFNSKYILERTTFEFHRSLNEKNLLEIKYTTSENSVIIFKGTISYFNNHMICICSHEKDSSSITR